jgi:hypothetical protein
VISKQLIKDHHNLFKSLYPDRPLISKRHFLIHYGCMIAMFAPLVKLWCMRLEGNCPMKRLALTLAYKNQVESMFSCKLSELLTKKVCIPNASPFFMVGYLQKKQQTIDNDFGMCSTIHVAHSVSVLGQTYRRGSFLPLNCDTRGECLFGETVHIIPECEKQDVLVDVC